MFKRILMAVDGSQTAGRALQEANKLAKERQGQRRSVRAVDTGNSYMGVEFVDPTDLIVIGTHGRQGLSRLLPGSIAEGGDTCRHETGAVDPRQMIHAIDWR